MNVLIVDDEVPARQRLRGLIQEIGQPYQVVGEAANGVEAVRKCTGEEVDLILMDIRMPGMDGLQAASSLSRKATPPAVIFVTAYEDHALAAFQENAVDYLLKPIRRNRLERALSRASAFTRPQLQALQKMQEGESGHVYSNYRGGVQRIPVEDIIYLRADQKYVTVLHSGGESLLEESLKSLEQRFAGRFLRIHRNALVARQRVIGLEKASDGRCCLRMEQTEERLEISRRHLAQVRRWLKSGRPH